MAPRKTEAQQEKITVDAPKLGSVSWDPASGRWNTNYTMRFPNGQTTGIGFQYSEEHPAEYQGQPLPASIGVFPADILEHINAVEEFFMKDGARRLTEEPAS